MKKTHTTILLQKLLAALMIASSCLFLIFLYHDLAICDDTIWHIKLGEDILSNHRLESTVSHSMHSTPFIQHEWASEILLSVINNISGITGLLFFSALMYFIGFMFCTFKNEFRLEKAVLISLLVFLGFRKTLYIIPDTIGMLLMLLGGAVITSKISVQRKLIYNALITVLIANFHGGVLIGYITQMIIFTVVETIFALRKKQSDIKVAGCLLGQSILCGLINPYGIKLYTYALMLKNENSVSYFYDWQPYHFSGLLPIIAFCILLFSLVYGFYKKIKAGKTFNKNDLLKVSLVILWLIMMLTYQRCINIFIYTLIYQFGEYISEGLSDAGDFIRKHIRLFTGTFAIISVLFLIGSLNIVKHKNIQEKVSSFIPEEVVVKLNSENRTVFNDWNIGGYLIYNNIDVFADGRTDPYLKSYNGGKDIIGEYCNACYYPEVMNQLHSEYNIDTLIFRNNTTQSELYRNIPEWKTEYKSEDLIILYWAENE